MPVWAIGRLTHSLTQTCTPKTGDRRRLESLAGADKDRDKTRRRLCRPTRVHAQRGREWGEWIYFGAQHACVPDYRLSCPLQGRVRCPGGGHGGGEGVGFGQHSAEGARKRTRGRWAVGAGHMGRARGEGGGGVCVCVVLVLAVVVGGGGCCDGSGGGGVGVGRGCMRCSRLRYATLRCTALLLWCSGALVLCDVRRSEAMGCKGRQRQRRGQRTAPGTRTRDAAKTPIRPRDAIVRKQVSTADAPPAMRGTVNTQCVLRIHLAAAAITTHTSSL